MACSQRLEFIQSVSCPKVSITVVEVMPSVTVIKTRDDLLAGTDQEVELVVRTGSTAFQNVFQRYSILFFKVIILNSAFRRKLFDCVLHGD